MNEAETHVTCPYNKAHTILKGRMQFHLTRCRTQHVTSEMALCPYNSVHVVPKIELDIHEQLCPDRNVLDSFVYDFGHTESSASPTVPINKLDLPPCEENWDDEGEGVSVLEVVKEKAKDKGVLLNLIGAPKAARKAHRLHERVRYQRVMDGHHENPSSSADATGSDGSNQEVKDVRMPRGKGKKKTANKPSNEITEKSSDQSSSPVSNNLTSGNLENSQDDIKKDSSENEDLKKDSSENEDLKKDSSENEDIKKDSSENEDIKKDSSENENYESVKTDPKVQTTSVSKQVLSHSPKNIHTDKNGNAWNTGKVCNGLKLEENNGTKSALLKSNTPLATNAWNIVDQKSATSFIANSDFPVLPVSGRGRGRKFNNKF